MPFEFRMSPFWSHRLAKPIKEQLTQWGIPHSWFVDDILILGQTEQQTTERASKAIQLLTELGIQINRKKFISQP